jgi:hypothetical protein
MMDIRETMANGFANRNLVAKVKHYCDQIKVDKSFKHPIQDNELVDVLLNFQEYEFNKAFAEGFEQGRFVKEARKKSGRE